MHCLLCKGYYTAFYATYTSNFALLLAIQLHEKLNFYTIDVMVYFFLNFSLYVLQN